MNYIRSLFANICVQACLCITYTATLTRRVVVIDTHGVLPAIQSDGGLIVCNHPSLVETIIMGGFLWRTQPKPPLSVADQKLFLGGADWLYQTLNCVPVSRVSNGTVGRGCNRRALKSVLHALRERRIVIHYPEAGRTCKGTRFLRTDAGVVRLPTQTEQEVELETMTSVAAKSKSKVYPVWIDHGPCPMQPESFLYGFWKLFFRQRMTIYIDTPLQPPLTRRAVLDELLAVAKAHRST